MRRTFALFPRAAVRSALVRLAAGVVLSGGSPAGVCLAATTVPKAGASKAAPAKHVPPFTVETGEIDGAKFAIARPVYWNARVLLLAHGYRAEDRPLVADLFPEHLAYRTLIEEGWIVAKTSYRRNGTIVADAVADLDGLRGYIAQKMGLIDRVLIEGESMGGLIGTIIAERQPEDPPLYAGIVGIGAALDVKENGATIGLSLQPKIPILFLTNQSELGGPRAYFSAAASRVGGELTPMVFRVSRDGHVNVNQRERLAAIRAMNLWLDHSRAALPQPRDSAPFFDATVAPMPTPSTVSLHEDARGLDAKVIEVSAVYGNLFIDAQPADLAAAGIMPGAWFELSVGEQKFRTRYGGDFSSVKRGEWVVFPNADGYLWLARNYGDAAASAGLKLGDRVTLRRFDETR
jgi:hypothetical protein